MGKKSDLSDLNMVGFLMADGQEIVKTLECMEHRLDELWVFFNFFFFPDDCFFGEKYDIQYQLCIYGL